jgi:hypothetical protein
LTTVEVVRSEILKKMKTDSDSECSEDSASHEKNKIKGVQAKLSQKCGMSPVAGGPDR